MAKSNAPEAPPVTEPTVIEATYWHCHARPVIRFAFRTPDDVKAGKREVTNFQPFFPGDSTKGMIPDSMRSQHSDDRPAIFRSAFITTDPDEIAFLDAKIPTGPDLILMGKREVPAQ